MTTETRDQPAPDRDPDGADDSGPAAGLNLLASERALPTLLVALAAVATVLALVMWFKADNAQGDLDSRRDAGRVAGEFTSAVIGYDADDLDGSLDRVLALASSDYEQTFRDAFFSEVRPFVAETEAKGQVSVRQAFVEDSSGDEASVVVFFDAVIESILGTRRLVGSYVRVDLVREDGQWKADDLAFLATTEEGLDPTEDLAGIAPEAGATTTTAPG